MTCYCVMNIIIIIIIMIKEEIIFDLQQRRDYH